MQLRFLGGARTVTGSMHLIEANGRKVLLECGLFQGRRQETRQRNCCFDFDPASLDAVVLSHAHIDHSGNLPNLVRQGFKGPIYATGATVDLCQLMLRDSAYLQEKDAEWVNKKRRSQNQPPIEPLYTLDDAEEAMRAFVGVQYGKAFSVCPGFRAVFSDAGHILGSAGVTLTITEKTATEGTQKRRLGFSGDIGRSHVPILRDPEPLRDLDALIMESTYGDRNHSVAADVAEELARAVRRTVEDGGKIIIPAFAVGRTQLLVYEFHKLIEEGRIPAVPVFVDSPLACNATEVFRLHPECFDRETHRDFLRDGVDPFGFERLGYIRDVEQSKALNALREPHIIISASGMAEAGRVLHHLRNNIGDRRNLVLLVGHAAEHTLARRLRDGHDPVRIFGEEHRVRCRVESMDYFSAHAGRDELLDHLRLCPPERLKRVFLVHGEEGPALSLAAAVKAKGYAGVEVPEPGAAVDF